MRYCLLFRQNPASPCPRRVLLVLRLLAQRSWRTLASSEQRKTQIATTLPITVVHVPHSSRHVPAEEREAICLDDVALDAELMRMTDAYTDELFPVTTVEVARLVFPVSRLICDVERFPLDQDEPMASRGVGVVYTRTSMGEMLRHQQNPNERLALLDRWYWPRGPTSCKRWSMMLRGDQIAA